MAVISNSHTELNALQISLLRMFNRPMSDRDVIELKSVLVKHYDKLLKKEANRVVAKKGYTQADFDRMLNDES
ncbi:hypothetical protein [Parapedobacter tibetensis]|uniref:hypothetical protein n=1 Tax=Parapedobacter tibetensis TaxID=2972951 RepID=UPI00214D475F|nr:hypothetical protein [Parapedobacter tibetensis]